ADDRELSCNRCESFSQLAFYLPARLGPSRSGVFDKPRCNDQLFFALCSDAASHAQTRNAANANRPGKNLRGWRTAGIGLLGRESLVARCMGAPALSPKVMRAACCDCVWRGGFFWRRVYAPGERSARDRRSFSAALRER